MEALQTLKHVAGQSKALDLGSVTIVAIKELRYKMSLEKLAKDIVTVFLNKIYLLSNSLNGIFNCFRTIYCITCKVRQFPLFIINSC